VEIFWKLLTVLIAALVAYVEYRQHRLGREKFKLDLFEKRFTVFAAARRLLTHVLCHGNVSREHFFEYRTSVGEATFLFESAITDYLDSIDKKALQLWTLTEEMKPLPVGEERSRVAGEISQTVGWLINQLPQLKIRFGPYLKFGTWT
jgi:hypothetical protein